MTDWGEGGKGMVSAIGTRRAASPKACFAPWHLIDRCHTTRRSPIKPEVGRAGNQSLLRRDFYLCGSVARDAAGEDVDLFVEPKADSFFNVLLDDSYGYTELWDQGSGPAALNRLDHPQYEEARLGWFRSASVRLT